MHFSCSVGISLSFLQFYLTSHPHKLMELALEASMERRGRGQKLHIEGETPTTSYITGPARIVLLHNAMP